MNKIALTSKHRLINANIGTNKVTKQKRLMLINLCKHNKLDSQVNQVKKS